MNTIEFFELYESKLSDLSRIVGIKKGMKRQAYELAEADHSKLTGKRRFNNYNTFASTRTTSSKSAKHISLHKGLKRKPQPRCKEFESKFNWIF